MKYVLDTSVAICWGIPRPLTPKAVRLRDEYQRQIHELLAPAAFIDEVAGALTKAERQKGIAIGQAVCSTSARGSLMRSRPFRGSRSKSRTARTLKLTKPGWRPRSASADGYAPPRSRDSRNNSSDRCWA